MKIRTPLALALLLLTPPAPRWAAADDPVADERFETRILMADGATLAADVIKPKGEGKWPVVLVQTPYGKQNFKPESVMDGGGYAFVCVDTRGRFDSKDAPQRQGVEARRTDGYACVEWAASQPWSTGKVGTWGPSALGQQQFRTAEGKPPHLACCVPMVSGFGWRYATFYPGGVLRTEYAEMLDRLGFGATGPIATHPYDDFLWKVAEALAKPDRMDVPMLFVGGWFDMHPDEMADDFKNLVARGGASARGAHRLLIGPWTHHFASSYRNDPGELPYRETVAAARKEIRAWFDRWLKGVETPAAPAVRYFVLGEDVWKDAPSWPPPGSPGVATLFLDRDGSLSRETTGGTGGKFERDEYVHDPNNPVKTLGGANLDPAIAAGPHDQRKGVLDRPDVLSYSTPPLSEPIRVAGRVLARLRVLVEKPAGSGPSATGLDADLHVRLCDVFPDGRAMLLADGARRLSLKSSFAAPMTVEPGATYDVEVVLPDLAVTFAAGHRVLVALSGSNSPRFEVHPEIPVRVTVFRGGENGSRVLLPLAGP